LELRQLRAFLQVSTTRHFGRAAATLNITQPALTQRIQALERELGMQLLTRSAREVRLTPAGEVLLPYANSLVQVEDRALRDLADNAAGRAGKLRVAYLLHGDVGTQGKIVGEFRRRYPEVAVETTMGNSRLNLDLLNNGTVDVGFIGPNKVPAQVAVQSTGQRPLVLALPEKHPLVEQASVPVSMLAGVPLILWPESWNPELLASFKQWLARHIGSEPNVIALEPADQALEAVATSGSAVTIVSGWRASAAPVSGIVFRTLVPEPFIEHQIAYMRNDPSPTLLHLLTITKEVLAANHSTLSKEAELL
jgi:DNA-binding transcriptional LysR family regulator